MRAGTLFSTFILCITASTFLHAQSRGGDRPKLVVTETLSFEYQTSQIEAVGTAEAQRSVTLFPSVTDEVTEVNFVAGQRVEKGEVLLRLDSRLQTVAVERAQIQLNEANRNLERVKTSLAKGAVTQREVDDTETQVKLARVNLQEALENKEDRLVRAPFSGIVGLTNVEVGDRVTPQTAITTLDKRNALFINFVAPELAVNYLLQKPQVTLQPWTDRETLLQANIAELDSRVNTQNRTIRARALLDNENDSFRPGMSFRVTLEVRGERYVAIPEAALSWGANGAFVWLADSSGAQPLAKRVNVQVQQRLRGRILVSGDLRDGESLVVEGIQSLRPGQALNIQNDNPGAQISRKPKQQQVAG